MHLISVDNTRMNPRGRLRRRRRIATETMQSHRRSQKWSSSVSDLAQEATFRVFFGIAGKEAPRWSKRALLFWVRSEAFGTLFSTLKTALVPAVDHKTVSKSHVSILLTTSLKSSSGASLVGTRSKLRLRRKNPQFHPIFRLEHQENQPNHRFS